MYVQMYCVMLDVSGAGIAWLLLRPGPVRGHITGFILGHPLRIPGTSRCREEEEEGVGQLEVCYCYTFLV